MPTKPNTLNEYSRRIALSLDYIQKHLAQSINLDQVAKASHFSPFHFHRIFHSTVGETVNDYITRKRMELSANNLVCNASLSITDIALSNGFSSSANFAKAFKNYFGISPSQLRNPTKQQNSKIGKIHSKYGKAFNHQDLYSQLITNQVVFEPKQLKEMMMNVNIQQFEEKPIVYLTAPKGYDLDAIFETWDKLSAWAHSSNIKNHQQHRYAICHDNPMMTPSEQCRYDASIMVDPSLKIKQPYQKSVIPKGEYAVAYFKGSGDKVSKFYMELYSNWLPNSGYEPDDYPPVAHYLNDSRKEGFVEMEVHIKLKALVTT